MGDVGEQIVETRSQIHPAPPQREQRATVARSRQEQLAMVDERKKEGT